jgi:hypothetical protein
MLGIPVMTLADELARRLNLWEQLSTGDTGNADPSVLRFALVYGGAQGIWVDKKTTDAIADATNLHRKPFVAACVS